MLDNKPLTKRLLAVVLVACAVAASLSNPALAQTGTLATPFPTPSPNAALHYLRALMSTSALDEADRKLLQQDIWEVIPGNQPKQGTAGQIKRLLYRARHATGAAGRGSRLEICNFGIDFSEAGGATILPHVQPMVELGRLLTLRGVYAQSQERWDEAAVIYFDVLRMGRHMTRQATLLEAIAGDADSREQLLCAGPLGGRPVRVPTRWPEPLGCSKSWLTT